MRAKFGVLWQTNGIRLRAKFHLDGFILSPSGGEKPQNFAVFGLRHYVMSPCNWQQPEKAEHGCITTNIPLSNSIKIVSVLQRLLAEIIVRTNSEAPFTQYSRLSNRLYNRFDNRLYRVNKYPTGDNRFDNRVERTAVRSTGCQPGCTTALTTGYIHDTAVLSNRLSNGFDNRLNVCIHDTTGCQTS